MNDGKRQRIFKVDGVEMCNGSYDTSIVSWCFFVFKKGKTIRFYSIDDVNDFSPAFELINGKCVDMGYLHYYDY